MAKFITFGRLGLPFATIELMLSNSLEHYPPIHLIMVPLTLNYVHTRSCLGNYTDCRGQALKVKRLTNLHPPDHYRARGWLRTTL